MRLFAIIMSVYLLGLSCFPCADSQAAKLFSTVATVVSVDHGQQHEHTSKAEMCSPFCVCSCCSTSAFYEPSILISENVTLPVQSLKYPAYTSELYPQTFASIWQPPKIA